MLTVSEIFRLLLKLKTRSTEEDMHLLIILGPSPQNYREIGRLRRVFLFPTPAGPGREEKAQVEEGSKSTLPRQKQRVWRKMWV